MQTVFQRDATNDQYIQRTLQEHRLRDRDVMDIHSWNTYHTLIGSDFWAIDGQLGVFDGDTNEDVRVYGGAMYEKDLIWVTLPEH